MNSTVGLHRAMPPVSRIWSTFSPPKAGTREAIHLAIW